MKLGLKKNSGLKGIRTHKLCYTGAVLYQLSYQANWKLATLWVCNIPLDGEEYIWVIDQVCSVKMAGYWPGSFFCVFMDRDEVEVHKLAKKERGQYPAILTEQTWSINDLLCGFRGNFSCGIQQVVPSGQDGSILPARVANHIAPFWTAEKDASIA